jgi:hypothetical protein
MILSNDTGRSVRFESLWCVYVLYATRRKLTDSKIRWGILEHVPIIPNRMSKRAIPECPKNIQFCSQDADVNTGKGGIRAWIGVMAHPYYEAGISHRGYVCLGVL